MTGLLLMAALTVAAQSSGAAPERELRPVVVWAVGDGADGSERARRLARLVTADRPDRFLYLGDVYESGTSDEFRRNYDSVYGELAEITAPTPGNHDWPNRQLGYYPYWRSAKGRRQRPWYRFRLAGWEVLALNSEAAHGAGSRQVRWLRRHLRGAEGDCRLAFWHRPRRSAGVYGDDEGLAPLWNPLRGKARLVLSGHDHNMQRFRSRDGIVQLVAGAGGRELYPLRDEPGLAFGNDRRYGALRLELRPGRAELEFQRLDGRRLDSSSVECQPG